MASISATRGRLWPMRGASVVPRRASPCPGVTKAVAHCIAHSSSRPAPRDRLGATQMKLRFVTPSASRSTNRNTLAGTRDNDRDLAVIVPTSRTRGELLHRPGSPPPRVAPG